MRNTRARGTPFLRERQTIPRARALVNGSRIELRESSEFFTVASTVDAIFVAKTRNSAPCAANPIR